MDFSRADCSITLWSRVDISRHPKQVEQVELEFGQLWLKPLDGFPVRDQIVNRKMFKNINQGAQEKQAAVLARSPPGMRLLQLPIWGVMFTLPLFRAQAGYYAEMMDSTAA